jgi:hypothetical protein
MGFTFLLEYWGDGHQTSRKQAKHSDLPGQAVPAQHSRPPASISSVLHK